MAVETLISPGVLAIENDRSFVTAGPVSVGAAIIGPTVKGPVEIPTVVTSYSDFVNKFGTTIISASNTYTYFTSIAAFNYFQNGGQSLLVSRVVRDATAWSPATSSINSARQTGATVSSAAIAIVEAVTASQTAFGIFSDSGSFPSQYHIFIPTASGNTQDKIGTNGKNYFFFPSGSTSASTAASMSAKINATTAYHGFTASVNLAAVTASSGLTNVEAINNKYSFATASNWNTQRFGSWNYSSSFSGGTVGNYTASFSLETISEGIIMNSSGSVDSSGALISGSADNIRWQVVNPDTSTGTFDLLIRQGNDTTNSPIVLETWTNLSLDPKASSYISKRIGDSVQVFNPTTNQMEYSGSYVNASRYVRVKSVGLPTPDYLDNNGVAKTAYTASIPLANNGAFGAATGDPFNGIAAKFYENISDTNTQGLYENDYINMVNLLNNKDDYQFNILFTPGLYRQDYAGTISTIVTNTQDRGDNIFVADMVSYGASVTDVTGQAAAINSSYATTYWPWCQVSDPATGDLVWVPASTVIAGVYAYNDSVAEPWFAPAGINRGGLGSVVRAEQKLPQSSRDSLYNGKVNPIATFPGQGVVVYGQKTLQTKASALDRVNVRRLLISLKSYISQVANTLVFEQNTAATRNNFLAQVNPYLENVQQRQGLYAFRVVMDNSNNTADVIDRNQLVGQIYVQPTKTAEFIYLDFIITPTGASFPA
jgi:phage tail sheath protein FI